MRATRAIIHLNRLSRNIAAVRAKIGPHPLICMPVKADAYGHGAVPVARAALEAGARYLAVATVDEGKELREGGITAPVLLLSIPLPEELFDAAACDLSPLIGDREYAEAAGRAAKQAGKRLSVHLKVDTGMGRAGCFPDTAADLAACVAACPSLEIAGTATHLAVADSPTEADIRYTKEQLTRFRAAVERIRRAGFEPGLLHAANSGAVIFHEDARFDMVRPGILLYGYKPQSAAWIGGRNIMPDIEPLMELVTQISFIKRLKAGETISYGRTWTAPRDTVIATLPVGYGDGLPRGLSGNFSVRIRDAMYPLAGRICMDQCMVDLGPDTDIKRWERVTLFGGSAPDAADLAAQLGTISYEITCNINKRVPREYRNEIDNRVVR
jgi:alanine racemase